MRHVPVPDLPDDFPIRHAQAHGVWRYSYHALSGIRVHKCVCVCRCSAPEGEEQQSVTRARRIRDR